MTMAAIRNGSGPIHLAWVEPDGFDTLCDRTIAKGKRVTAWKAGELATAIWKSWRRCPKCEEEHKRRRR